MTFSILDAARDAPETPALSIDGATVTFAEVGARAGAIVAVLERRGLPTPDGTPVLLAGKSDLPTLLLFYALLEIGQPVALLHPRLTATEREPLERLVTPGLCLDAGQVEAESSSVKRGSPGARAPIDAESCLAILFTSGTTGTPKGVRLSRRAFAASARASAKNFGFHPSDRWLLGLPIAHVGGLSVLTRCLLARRAAVVPTEIARGERFDGLRLARAIDRLGATIVSLVPTQLDWLLAHDARWAPPAELRVVLLGGAPASPSLLERARDRGVPVYTTYGLTEACSQVTTEPYAVQTSGERGVGLPLDGVEVRIVSGKIQVRGLTSFSGYFPGDSEPRSPADWFETDDFGRLDERGCLHVLGRSSDLVITGGENVFPSEVEPVLERCPGVAQACVFGVPDGTWGELVGAAIVANSEGPPTDETLVKYLTKHLAPHRRPRRIAVVPELCLTGAGKLDRKRTAANALGNLRPLRGV